MSESDPKRFLWDEEDIAGMFDKSKSMSQKLSRGPHGFSAGSKGCVMANFSDDQAKPVLEYGKTIDSKDLAEDGLETVPHITALYGLTSDSQGPVVEVCRQFGPLSATLGLVESFENTEYDVLKISVTSPDLAKVNEALKKLPYQSDFPDFSTHVTIAYLKPGTAKKYVGSDIFKGIVLTFDSLVFSDSQHNKRTIALTESEAMESILSNAKALIQKASSDQLGEMECRLLEAKSRLL